MILKSKKIMKKFKIIVAILIVSLIILGICIIYLKVKTNHLKVETNHLKVETKTSSYESDYKVNWTTATGDIEISYMVISKSSSGGYVVVGSSLSTDSSGDDTDSAIIKYNKDGTIAWSHSTGGSAHESYISVIEVSDGYVVVGSSWSTDAPEWGNKGRSDAIIVKYNEDGKIVWSHSAGGKYSDDYNSIVEVSDGYVVVGGSWSKNAPEWGSNGRSSSDAIIVKYNKDGTIAWSHNAGGSAHETYKSVIAVPDGYVAIGDSDSIDASEWENIGLSDGIPEAIIVKYNEDGTVAWGHNSGGRTSQYNSIVAEADGYVVAGFLYGADTSSDATIIKYNEDGTIAWSHSAGGSETDVYSSVIAVRDGYVAVGYSYSKDASEQENNDGSDAIIVKYNKDGTVAWSHYAGVLDSIYNSVIAVPDGYLVIGYSYNTEYDANSTIVKYDTTGNTVWTYTDKELNYFYDNLYAIPNGYVIIKHSDKGYNFSKISLISPKK